MRRGRAVDSAADDDLKKIVFKRGEDIKRSLAREDIHRRQVQARLGQAWAEYETGLTWPPESSRAQQRPCRRPTSASIRFATSSASGLPVTTPASAAAFAAVILGDAEKAFAIFEELLRSLPDEPADFHALRGKAAVQALEISLVPEAKKYKQGVDIAQRWVAAATASERCRTSSISAIRFPGRGGGRWPI